MTTRRWFIALAICAATVGVCMAFVDRPVADYVQAYLSQTTFFIWTSRAFILLDAAMILMVVLLIASGVWVLSGRPLPAWTQLPLAVSGAAVWALGVAAAMKHLIGQSFPSVTIAVTAACLAVVWICAPRFRAAGAGLLALIAVALVLTNSHWVSDVIGGGFVGALVGWMTVVLKRPEH